MPKPLIRNGDRVETDFGRELELGSQNCMVARTTWWAFTSCLWLLHWMPSDRARRRLLCKGGCRVTVFRACVVIRGGSDRESSPITPEVHQSPGPIESLPAQQHLEPQIP